MEYQEEPGEDVDGSFEQESHAVSYSQKYGLIAPGERRIRLLKVLRPKDQEVECEICTHVLNEAPPYFALSYVWGDVKATDTITVGGEPFSVTTNLKSALYDLASQQEEEPLLLWVDAI